MVDLNLPRNEFPINELDYEDKIYPFSKTRLIVGQDNYAFITYIFDGGKEKLDEKPLFDEFIETLKTDKEFAELKKREWPEGFTDDSDKKLLKTFFKCYIKSCKSVKKLKIRCKKNSLVKWVLFT
ncbi:hypothetical protein [Bacillus sp. EB600]|uniref:hypothetical protein n=1 Tax=Bacillus sp. EB600 TaxID=2806345 RepID=UPI00210B2D0C|nr:hypothetical protein [Bacillus sp. EB600]MCQ6282080.1 hypothetical protein [Bacillus sp. EB600]